MIAARHDEDSSPYHFDVIKYQSTSNLFYLSFRILQFIAPKGLAAFGSIDILHKKCFHHFVMETFWRYELQNAETRDLFYCFIIKGDMV